MSTLYLTPPFSVQVAGPGQAGPAGLAGLTGLAGLAGLAGFPILPYTKQRSTIAKILVI